MDTVELFAGVGGFRLAADASGFATVWANDNSSVSCAVYRDRFGGSALREGDLLQVKDEVPPHDLLTAGFPCQPFSSAGKKEGVRDWRGTLFEAVVAILRRRQPRYFILENVKRLLTMERGFHFATILASLAELNYQIEWRLLNALHFGLPQNRERVFILGTRMDSPQTRESKSPGPNKLASAADLEHLPGQQIDELGDRNAWAPIERHGLRFPTWGLALQGRFFGADLREFSCRSAPVPLRSVLQPVVPARFDFTESTLQWIGANTPVNRFVQGVQILSNQAGGSRMGYTIFGIDGVAPTLTSTTSRHYERYKVGDRYRRLTNIEYARIQGFPDNHCSAVSLGDQYALLGNAVPPPMAEWVMKQMTVVGVSLDAIPRKLRQLSLFDHAHRTRTAGPRSREVG